MSGLAQLLRDASGLLKAGLRPKMTSRTREKVPPGTVHVWRDGTAWRKVTDGHWEPVRGTGKADKHRVVPNARALAAAIAHWQARLKDQPIEHAVALAQDGRVIARARGDADSVTFQSAELEAIEHYGHAVVLHNHPGDEPLNDQDIEEMFRNGWAAVRSVGPSGVGYEFRRPAGPLDSHGHVVAMVGLGHERGGSEALGNLTDATGLSLPELLARAKKEGKSLDEIAVDEGFESWRTARLITRHMIVALHEAGLPAMLSVHAPTTLHVRDDRSGPGEQPGIQKRQGADRVRSADSEPGGDRLVRGREPRRGEAASGGGGEDDDPLAKAANPADVVAAAEAAAEHAHRRATLDILTAIVPIAGVDPWLMAVLMGQLLTQADPDDIDEMRAWPLGRWAVAVRAHLDVLATAEPEAASPLAMVPTPKPPIDVEPGPVPIQAVPPLALPAPEPRGDRDRRPPAEPHPAPRPKLYLVPQEPEPTAGGAGGSGGGGGPPIPAPPPGLPDEIREAWIQARTRAGEYCRGLGNVIRKETGELVREAWGGEDIVTEVDREHRLRTMGLIREQTAEALAQGWTPERLASELANRTLDWSRDWTRIARTELQAAMNDGAFVEGIRTFGHGARFARVPNADACKTCRRLFLDEDGRPRIFTAQELLAAGTNVGRKGADLRATLYPVHPHCLLPGSLVTTARGEVAIEGVLPGDVVLSHDGTWNAVLGAWVSAYDGQMHHISADGRTATATELHPFAARDGWRHAHGVQVGDELLCLLGAVGRSANPDAVNPPTLPEKSGLFARVLSGFTGGGVPVTAVDLDGEFVVWERHIDEELRDGVARLGQVAGLGQRIKDLSLVVRLWDPGLGRGHAAPVLGGASHAADGIVCGSRESGAILWGHEEVADRRGLVAPALDTPRLADEPIDHGPVDVVATRYLHHRQETVEVESAGDGWVQFSVGHRVELVRGDDGLAGWLCRLPGRVVAGVLVGAGGSNDLTETHQSALDDVALHTAPGRNGAARVPGGVPGQEIGIGRQARSRAAMAGDDARALSNESYPLQRDAELFGNLDLRKAALVSGNNIGVGEWLRHAPTVAQWRRIDNVTCGHYRGPVFNLSIAGPQSFVADGFAVHNCVCSVLSLPDGFTLNRDWDMVREEP